MACRLVGAKPLSEPMFRSDKNKNDILNKYQFGFRNNHSTYMALVILLENLNALDNGECAIGIFLDF